MELTAIYGGAFDPVHNGHLAVARAAAHALGAQVRLLPTGDPNHRAPAHANGAHRAAMLRLAIAGDPSLSVDTRELDRPGTSYTVDTLTDLRAELGPDVALAMIVGADAFVGLPTWHRWRTLFALAHLVVAERPGVLLPEPPLDGEPRRPVSLTPLSGLVSSDVRDLPPSALVAAAQDRWTFDPADLHAAPAGRILRLRLPMRSESSNAIRTRLGAGESIAAYVPPAVEAYLREHRLYH